MARRGLSTAAATLLATLTLSVGCGGGPRPPSENDIWHEPALRPGRSPARSPGEEAVLARLSELPADEPVRLEGEVFVAEAPYAAASGRVCRRVQTGSDPRLACQMGSQWTFVPEVFEDPAEPAVEHVDPQRAPSSEEFPDDEEASGEGAP